MATGFLSGPRPGSRPAGGHLPTALSKHPVRPSPWKREAEQGLKGGCRFTWEAPAIRKQERLNPLNGKHLLPPGMGEWGGCAVVRRLGANLAEQLSLSYFLNDMSVFPL